MKTKCLTAVILIVVGTLCARASGQEQDNAAAAATVADVLKLEGKWKVASTTWGGDPKDFLGVIYSIDVDYKSIATEEKVTEFIVVLDSSNEGDSGFLGFSPARMVDQKFCAMQYSELPSSYKLFEGYPRAAFWHLEDYPCAAEDHNKRNENDPDREEEDPSITINSSKNLLRLNMVSETEIHATVYYEITEYAAATEDQIDKEKIQDMVDIDCAKGMCYGGYTFAVGTFELVLKKLNSK